MNNKLRFSLILGLLLAASAFTVSNVLAAQGTSKPGHGYGDIQHVHTGPPGQSVRP